VVNIGTGIENGTETGIETGIETGLDLSFLDIGFDQNNKNE